MVIDTSALMAVFFKEEQGPWVTNLMEENRGLLRMSLINLTELLILLEDHQPQLFPKLKDELMTSGIRFVAPTNELAAIAAQARLRFSINLGDCFAYALSKVEDVPLLTLDRNLRKTDAQVVMPF